MSHKPTPPTYTREGVDIVDALLKVLILTFVAIGVGCCGEGLYQLYLLSLKGAR